MSDIQRQLGHLKNSAGNSESSSSSIKDKLDRLYNRDSSVKFFPEEEVVRSHKRLEELVSGEYVNTSAGDIYRARSYFDAEYVHGNINIRDIYDIDVDCLLQLGKVEPNDLNNLDNALFLDTEASGLSGGAGTYAFMIGVGYFDQGHLVVDQLFVDSYAKEEGMLDILRAYCEQASIVVTFNGKSFDLNLLETRYIMHGQFSPFADLIHLDLLHPARNLWNLDLQNCRLQTLERDILQFLRQNDTPGSEVPGIYFEFIRTGDPDEIAGVFEHNVHDIVSLVAVTILLEQNFSGSRDVPVESGLTMYSRGKIFEKQLNYDQAIHCYKKSLQHELSINRRQKILSSIAAIYKKRRQYDEAINYWNRSIQDSALFILEPYEELAKYYEHKKKDFSEAIVCVDTALAEIPEYRADDIRSLQHRRNRLLKKIDATG